MICHSHSLTCHAWCLGVVERKPFFNPLRVGSHIPLTIMSGVFSRWVGCWTGNDLFFLNIADQPHYKASVFSDNSWTRYWKQNFRINSLVFTNTFATTVVHRDPGYIPNLEWSGFLNLFLIFNSHLVIFPRIFLYVFIDEIGMTWKMS